MKAILANHLMTPETSIEDAVVLIENGRITSVDSAADRTIPAEAELIPSRGLTIAPGLIDVHTHGAAGLQFNDGGADTVAGLARFYARHGVTGFLAGVWGTHAQLTAGIDAATKALSLSEWHGGAELLGIYLEGPFINVAHAGAFVLESIKAPDLELLRSYLDRAEGAVKLLTLAPELPGAAQLLALASARGVVNAIGHSGASWEEACEAATAGVRHVTHLFNAMLPLHHRTPGALGAALSDDRFTVEIIADGIHVHPAIVRLLTRTKRPHQVVLITDSIGAAGLPDGRHELSEVNVNVGENSARLDDGTLAGSTLTMERGVHNLVEFGAATLGEALAMGSLNAARLLGLAHRKGRIAPGFDADLVAFFPDLEVAWTMVGGTIVYRAEDS